MRRAMAALALPFPHPLPKPYPPFKPKLLLSPFTLPCQPPFSASHSIFSTFRCLSSSSATLITSPTPTPTPLLSRPPPKNDTGFDLEPYLACSMPGRRLRVAVLLSGGVDSSVALRLLHAAGHECTAFYLKIWFQEDFKNFWSECPWDDDLKYATTVCDTIDVPLEVVHLSDEYWNNVVTHIINEYRCGRTPNPDVLCNTRIKFGAFLEAVQKMEFDYIASGHYAHVVHSSPDNPGGLSMLKLSRDMVKDQTYFLSHLSQPQLKRLLFPLGCMQKEEVRNLATQMDLPNKYRKDSQGICFLGKVRHGPGFYECSIKHKPSKDDENEDCLEVHLNEDDQGLAAGQFTAFYHGDICLGSGTILDSIDASAFPICSRALELAQLEDKLKLGKPVRIMNL